MVHRRILKPIGDRRIQVALVARYGGRNMCARLFYQGSCRCDVARTGVMAACTRCRGDSGVVHGCGCESARHCLVGMAVVAAIQRHGDVTRSLADNRCQA